MSNLGVTYFCANGHVVLDVMRGVMTEPPKECQYCHSRRIKPVVEWHDEDYWDQGNTDSLVSHNHTRLDTVQVKIPVYDVKKLFNNDTKKSK